MSTSKNAVLPIVDKMIHEKFLGKKCISGEDKRLTFLIQKKRMEDEISARRYRQHSRSSRTREIFFTKSAVEPQQLAH
jgi:hypothetical protein